jgi:threonine synthase
MQLNPTIQCLECSETGKTYPADPARPWGLSEAGAPLLVRYDLRRLRLDNTPARHRGNERGLWRYAPLLPVHGVETDYAQDVGETRTVTATRLGRDLDVELHLKNEASNPSGSFKDRGLAMGIALGVACGAKRFCLPTQGNAGVAAAMFSARAGLPSPAVFMPEPHRGSAYHRAAEAFGASVSFHGSNIAAAGKRMREEFARSLASGEAVDISTFFEPGRLEGKKTMGLEIYDHFGGNQLPEFIVYPTGGGTGLVGIWKALLELIAIGLIPDEAPLPRLIAVQSDRCAPIVEAFKRGDTRVTPVTSGGTLADGLDVPGAIMGHGVLSAIRESKGTAASVSEEDIESTFSCAGRHGVSVSYEGAATLAAIRLLRETDFIQSGAKVLALNTAGHGTAIGRQLTDALARAGADRP